MRLALLAAFLAPCTAIHRPAHHAPPVRTLQKRGGGLKERLPIAAWLPALNQSNVLNDALAGLTVAAMLIPQGMSYASIAGLNPIVGLYCYVPMLVYACLAASSFVVVGPVALISTTLAPMIAAEATEAGRLAAASSLMFWSGAATACLGLSGLGGLVERVPKDVLSAFVTCCAFNIAGTQIPAVLKVAKPAGHTPLEMLLGALRNAPSYHSFTAAFSAATFAFLMTLKRLPLHALLKLPAGVPATLFASLGPFLAMVMGILANQRFDLVKRGLAEVGVVPSGLPSILSPLTRPPPRIRHALVLSFVALTETLAMGKALAERTDQQLDTSQEILAIGAANVAGSCFQSYTVAGSFSRSAVNVVTGGQSQLSSIVTAGTVVLTLLFFTGCFERVPKAVLGSILIYAVSGLIDVKRVRALAANDKRGLAAWVVFFGLMMALGPAEGLVASVAVDAALGVIRRRF
jgi:SulP family sulfate permease